MPHNRQIIATTKSARTPSKWLGNESVTRPGNHSNDKVEEKVGIETGGHPTQSAHHSNDKIGLRLRQNGSATSPSHGPEIIATTRSKKSNHRTVTGVVQVHGSEVNLSARRRPSLRGPTNLAGASSERVSLGACGPVPNGLTPACRPLSAVALLGSPGGGTRARRGAARRHGSRPCMCKVPWGSSSRA